MGIANVSMSFLNWRCTLILLFLTVLNVFFARELSERLRDKPLIVNSVNPGLCHSELARNMTGISAWFLWLQKLLMARTTEQGSRQLIWACIGGKDNIDQLRGAYISSMEVREPSDFVVSEEGKRAQPKLWVNNNHLSCYRITDKRIFVVRMLWLTSWWRRIHQYEKLLKDILRLPWSNELTDYRVYLASIFLDYLRCVPCLVLVHVNLHILNKSSL